MFPFLLFDYIIFGMDLINTTFFIGMEAQTLIHTPIHTHELFMKNSDLIPKFTLKTSKFYNHDNQLNKNLNLYFSTTY